MVECLGDPALAAAVRSHHERWDGSGYPDGLAGERIPLEARIISVVDTFDAITSARSYRPATPHAKALKIIDEEAGRQLDPDAARAFISCYSDRRGAALWAGIASVPRQVAERLAITPGEISGVLATALTAPLVVVAGAMAAEALPGPPIRRTTRQRSASKPRRHPRRPRRRARSRPRPRARALRRRRHATPPRRATSRASRPRPRHRPAATAANRRHPVAPEAAGGSRRRRPGTSSRRRRTPAA